MYYLNYRCRHNSPVAGKGFAQVYPDDPGCGDHKLDKEMMNITFTLEGAR